jgi:hypothetical protein
MALLPTRIKLIAATTAALLMGGITANAQSDMAGKVRARIADGVKKLEAGCGADVKKFCASVTPGEGRLFYCIMAHEDKISTKCDYALFDASRNLERALDRIEDVADACWNDVEKNCSDVPEGGGRIIQCLMAKKASLSKECQAAATKIQEAK